MEVLSLKIKVPQRIKPSSHVNSRGVYFPQEIIRSGQNVVRDNL